MKIGVMGAGAIGCWVGGELAAAGDDVVFVGRARLRDEIAQHGLRLIDLGGRTTQVPPDRIAFETDPAPLAACDVVLCCVKSAQTAGTGEALARVLPRDAVVVSLQNGVRNAEALRAALPGRTVLGGIVGFNVLLRAGGELRRATSGPLVIEASARVEALAAHLGRAGFEVEIVRDILPMQWAKLVMNLNNAVSALSDAPTRDLLFTPGYRRVLGAIIGECLRVYRRAGVRPARLGAIPVTLFPALLRLPTPLLRVVARAQLAIDPEARSSMWEDLAKGRATEVEYLNGEIVRLAESCGADAPINARVVEIVHRVERAGTGSPKLDPDALWAALTSSGPAA